jgi:hypothetical protein
MPTAQVIVRQANGQSLVLSENDRIVKEVTISCESPRCASRHGQDKPVEFTFNDQDPFPEAGDQFMSLILPERSPSNPQYPRPFCSPTCLRDYLMYAYLAPSPRETDKFGLQQSTETVQPPICGNYKEYVGDGIGCDKEPGHEGNCGKRNGAPVAESQADGCADPADVHGA